MRLTQSVILWFTIGALVGLPVGWYLAWLHSMLLEPWRVLTYVFRVTREVDQVTEDLVRWQIYGMPGMRHAP